MTQAKKTVEEVALEAALREYPELTRYKVSPRLTYRWGFSKGYAAAKAERRWIPVTERLPEKNGVYEAWSRGRAISVRYHQEYGFSEAGEVTHWCELDEGPEYD